VTLRSGNEFQSTRIGSTAGTSHAAPKNPRALSRFGQMVGVSVQSCELFSQLTDYAVSSAAVLIEGETGTGKELAAKALHEASPRSRSPFVTIDCGALPENLLESELFGHVKGAFTGAATTRVGAIEEANRGTVFLDEIGEIPINLQPKLLRVLESRMVRRVGENGYRSVDVRFISATHRDLLKMVSSRDFREDLYFRLAVLPVRIPPLRERPEDIPALVRHMLPGHDWSDVALDVWDELLRRPWFGNVRELRNFVDRVQVLGVRNAVDLAPRNGRERQLPAWQQYLPDDLFDLPLRDCREYVYGIVEQEYIKRLLKRKDKTIAEAARRAGLSRTYLHRVIARHK
jgi:transcriptional regulator with GAF, ATPase, and Fis domain